VTLGRKIAVNASALSSGRALMALGGVVSVGITTRYLGLEAYGSFVAAQGLIAVVGTVTDIGLWSVAAREIAKRPQDTQRTISAVLTAGLALSGLAALVGVGAALLVYSGEDDHLVRQGALMLMLTLPLSAPFGAANGYFISQQRAYMGMLGAMLASVVTLAGVALAAALDWGFTGVVGAYLAATVVQGLLVIALARGEVRLVPSLDFRYSKKMLVWSLPLGGTLVLHALYWRFDIVLLSKLVPAAEVALYGVAIKVVEALLALPNFVLITLLPEFSRLTSDRARFEELMQKAFSVMQVGAIGLGIFLAAFATEITQVVGGARFAEAGSVLRIMAVAVLCAYPASIFGDAFFVHNKQKYTFFITAAVLPVNIALNVAFIPIWGAQGSALGWAISEVFILASYLLLYRRHIGPIPRVHRAAGLFGPPAAMGAVALLKELPGLDGLSPGLVLALGAVLCPAVYVGGLYAFKAMPEELHAHVLAPLWARVRPG
jgi:O-antigen/teichoic acid export membrane protein